MPWGMREMKRGRNRGVVKTERTQVFIKQLPHRASLLVTPGPPSPLSHLTHSEIWILFGVTLKAISLIIPELGLHDIVLAKNAR